MASSGLTGLQFRTMFFFSSRMGCSAAAGASSTAAGAGAEPPFRASSSSCTRVLYSGAPMKFLMGMIRAWGARWAARPESSWWVTTIWQSPGISPTG